MSHTTQPSLSTPVKIGDVELRNRNLMSSLTRNRSVPDTIPNEANRLYYVQRARYAGLVNTEGTLISPQGSVWPWAAGIWSKEQVEAWKTITKDVHGVDGKIFCQLWHLGRVCNNDMPEQKKAGKPVPSASNVQCRGGEGSFKRYGLDESAGYSVPTPIEDPWEYVAEFKQAAINAKEAGFDGVELHGANGYLPHQFLDNTTNLRTDEWGDSIKNRSKFTLECLKALIEVWGPGRVGIKLSPGGGYDDMGMPLKETIDTFSYLIKEIVSLNISYITLVRYSPMLDPEIDGKKRGTPHDILETYGSIVKGSQNTKLFLNSGLTPDEANKLIGSGKIDAAVFGMLYITNPDLQRRVEKGKPLNTDYNFKTFYASGTDDPNGGYTDYPDAE